MKIRCLHSLNFLMDSLVKGRTCSMVRQIKILICLYLLPLKTDHPGVVLVRDIQSMISRYFQKGPTEQQFGLRDHGTSTTEFENLKR